MTAPCGHRGCVAVEVIEWDHTHRWVLSSAVIGSCEVGRLDPAPVLGIHPPAG